MLDLIKLFVQEGISGIWKKILILLIVGVFFLLVDTFTSYPSLSFTHDKYSTLKTMSELLKDSTLSPQQRAAIREEFDVVLRRQSLKDVTHNIGKRNAVLAYNISHIPRKAIYDNPGSAASDRFPPFISWVIFILLSTGFFTLVLIVMIVRSIFKKQSTTDKWIEVSASVLFIGLLVGFSYLIMLFISPDGHIVKYSLLTQFITFLLFAAVGKGMQWWEERRIRRVATVTVSDASGTSSIS